VRRTLPCPTALPDRRPAVQAEQAQAPAAQRTQGGAQPSGHHSDSLRCRCARCALYARDLLQILHVEEVVAADAPVVTSAAALKPASTYALQTPPHSQVPTELQCTEPARTLHHLQTSGTRFWSAQRCGPSLNPGEAAAGCTDAGQWRYLRGWAPALRANNLQRSLASAPQAKPVHEQQQLWGRLWCARPRPRPLSPRGARCRVRARAAPVPGGRLKGACAAARSVRPGPRGAAVHALRLPGVGRSATRPPRSLQLSTMRAARRRAPRRLTARAPAARRNLLRHGHHDVRPGRRQ